MRGIFVATSASRQLLGIAALIAIGCIASGCTDRVMFGTYTSFGVDIDTTPQPTISVGLDRAEVVVAPHYANGAIPPVVASIKSTAGIFTAGVSQVYATGQAARNVTRPDTDPKPQATNAPTCGDQSHDPPLLKRSNDFTKMVVFGTYTNVGLKVAFAGEVPKSFNFGYKRGELSVIPVGTCPDGTDAYGSVLAAVTTDANAAKFKQANAADKGDSTNFTYIAYFATGVAANNLAKNPEIRGAFVDEAKGAVVDQKLVAAIEKQRDDAIGAIVAEVSKPDGTINYARFVEISTKAGWAKGVIDPRIKEGMKIEDFRAVMSSGNNSVRAPIIAKKMKS